MSRFNEGLGRRELPKACPNLPPVKPGQVKLQQLQLNAKQSMLDFKHQEADDLKSQLSQVMKQRNASHFGLHSLFPLLFLLLFLVHLWVFSDILPAVLGIRDCLLAPPKAV